MRRTLPDPAAEPTITVARAAAVLGISRRAGYGAAERGEFPVIRVGRSIRVSTARFLRQYGLLVDQTDHGSELAALTGGAE